MGPTKQKKEGKNPHAYAAAESREQRDQLQRVGVKPKRCDACLLAYFTFIFFYKLITSQTHSFIHSFIQLRHNNLLLFLFNSFFHSSTSILLFSLSKTHHCSSSSSSHPKFHFSISQLRGRCCNNAGFLGFSLVMVKLIIFRLIEGIWW
ncbi:hypothetical protein RIF29_16724 [Crotalaria pallida]|uniref:Transmembrane protein n=1 Tax=Crotalaria pallida TaxID=3830 RepID=A0AAN9IFT9_CROPI